MTDAGIEENTSELAAAGITWIEAVLTLREPSVKVTVLFPAVFNVIRAVDEPFVNENGEGRTAELSVDEGVRVPE